MSRTEKALRHMLHNSIDVTERHFDYMETCAEHANACKPSTHADIVRLLMRCSVVRRRGIWLTMALPGWLCGPDDDDDAISIRLSHDARARRFLIARAGTDSPTLIVGHGSTAVYGARQVAERLVHEWTKLR